MDSEKIEGVIPVLTRLAFGSERLNLYLTERRVIIAHIGKRGAGAVAGTSLLGRLSSAFEDLLKTGKESRGKRKLESANPIDILRADKDNFAIPYEDIVKVDVNQNPRLVDITIISKDQKLEFMTRNSFENVVNVLSERLGSKLVARKIFG